MRKISLVTLLICCCLAVMSGCAPALPGISGFGLNSSTGQLEGNATEAAPVDGAPLGFSLVYSYDKGAVSPKYHYAYWIVLESNLMGRIEYQPGYPADSPPKWVEEFPVTAEEYVELYTLLTQAKVFETDKWSKHPFIAGAPSESLKVTANNKIFIVPNQAGSTEDEIKQIANVYEKINALVPKEIMDRLSKQQREYEESYGNRATWKTPIPK